MLMNTSRLVQAYKTRASLACISICQTQHNNCSFMISTPQLKRIVYTILADDVHLCKACHKRFHPTCTMYETAVRADDRLCDTCMTRDATVVCPQCAGQLRVISPLNCVLLTILVHREFNYVQVRRICIEGLLQKLVCTFNIFPHSIAPMKVVDHTFEKRPNVPFSFLGFNIF